MTTSPTLINERYPINLLPHRVDFHAARPTWESDRLDSMYEMGLTGWTIFDVGAEEGDFTSLYRSWVGDNGTIVAIEPSPCYWPAIRATWEGNGFAGLPICVPAFACDRTYVPEWSDKWKNSHAATIKIADDGWPRASTGPIVPDCGFRMLCERQPDTPGWRMDDLSDFLGVTPDAIMFDIEGAEWHALSGCERLVAPDGPRPVFWVSVHDENMINAYGKQFSDIIRLVISWNYDYRYLGTHGGEDFWLFTPLEAP